MLPRGLALALLLLTVPLVGCLGAEEEPLQQQSVDPLLPAAPAFQAPTAMAQDKGAAEPNIAALDDGTLFITAPVGLSEKPNTLEGAAWLWRSTDGGQSWETLRDPYVQDERTLPEQAPLDGAFCSCDADVVTSPDGWTYYSDWWIAGLAGPGNYLVEASPDGGQTWQQMPVTIPHASNVDRQWLVAGQEGFVGLFYSYFGTLPSADPVLPDTPFQGRAIQAVFSHDHGQSWSQPVDVVTTPDQSEAYQIAHPRLLPDGTLVMPYGAVDTTTGDSFWEAPSQVRVALSQDQGRSWEQVTVAEAPLGFDNLWAVQGAVDDAGNAHVAWAARTPEDDQTMSVYLASSADGARTWTDPVTLRGQGLNFLPWVAARGDGQVAVGWYGGNATGDPVDAGEEATWYAYVAERADAQGGFAVAKVDQEPVKVGPMCPLGASCGDDRELLDYVSLTYADDGRLHYAYARSGASMPGTVGALVHHAAETVAPADASG